MKENETQQEDRNYIIVQKKNKLTNAKIGIFILRHPFTRLGEEDGNWIILTFFHY